MQHRVFGAGRSLALSVAATRVLIAVGLLLGLGLGNAAWSAVIVDINAVINATTTDGNTDDPS